MQTHIDRISHTPFPSLAAFQIHTKSTFWNFTSSIRAGNTLCVTGKACLPLQESPKPLAQKIIIIYSLSAVNSLAVCLQSRLFCAAPALSWCSPSDRTGTESHTAPLPQAFPSILWNPSSQLIKYNLRWTRSSPLMQELLYLLGMK